jgi:hypothetical protein
MYSLANVMNHIKFLSMDQYDDISYKKKNILSVCAYVGIGWLL